MDIHASEHNKIFADKKVLEYVRENPQAAEARNAIYLHVIRGEFQSWGYRGWIESQGDLLKAGASPSDIPLLLSLAVHSNDEQTRWFCSSLISKFTGYRYEYLLADTVERRGMCAVKFIDWYYSKGVGDGPGGRGQSAGARGQLHTDKVSSEPPAPKP